MSRGHVTAWVLGALLTLLYVYLVVAAIGNVIGLTDMATAIGLTLTPVGWWWLMFGIALPIVVFMIALVIGRQRSAAVRVVVLAAGIAAVAAFQLEITHLVPQSSFFAA